MYTVNFAIHNIAWISLLTCHQCSKHLPGNAKQLHPSDTETNDSLELTHCSLELTHCSLELTHCSLELTHCSLELTHCSLELTHCSLELTHCSLELTHCSLELTHCSLELTHCSLELTHCSLELTHCSLELTHCSLELTHCSLELTHCSLELTHCSLELTHCSLELTHCSLELTHCSLELTHCSLELTHCSLELTHCSLELTHCSLELTHCSLELTHCSLELTHCSLELTHCSLELTHCSLELTHCSLELTHCSLELTHCSLELTHCSLELTHCSLELTHCSLELTHCSLELTHCSLELTHCSLELTHCSLVSARPPCSSIVNMPGESTLRKDFIRLQQENKERSEALRRQQLLQEQQLREQEEYKRQLLAERQKRIEQQKEQRRRLEEQQRREREMRRQQEREQRRREQEEKRRMEEMERRRKEDDERRRAEEEKRRSDREQEYIRRQLEEEQRHLEILQQQLLHEQAMLLPRTLHQEFKWRELEEQRKAERLHKRLQQEQAYLLSLQHDNKPPQPCEKTEDPKRMSPDSTNKAPPTMSPGPVGDRAPAPQPHVLNNSNAIASRRTSCDNTRSPHAHFLDNVTANAPRRMSSDTTKSPQTMSCDNTTKASQKLSPNSVDKDSEKTPSDNSDALATQSTDVTKPSQTGGLDGPKSPQTDRSEASDVLGDPQPIREADERFRKNIQGSPQTAPPTKQPPVPPRSEPFSNGSSSSESVPPAMHRPMEPQVPVRTTSRSPVLSRRDSPLQASAPPSNQAVQRNAGSNAEPRLLWDRVEKLVPRPGSGSSSGSSSSQAGSGERFRARSSSKSEGSPLQRPDNAAKKPDDKKDFARPNRPADLTALAKELRAVEDVRPPNKVTDYSSSSEESGTTDEDDDEEVDQDAADESTSGAEDTRAGRGLSNGETASLKTLLAHDDSENDLTTPSKDGTLVIRQSAGDKKRLAVNVSSSSSGPSVAHGQAVQAHTTPPGPGNGHQEKNGFAGRIHLLPDLIQQSHHSPTSASSTSSSISISPSSSHVSPAMSPQTPLDKLTAIETHSASNTMQKHKSSSSFTPFIDPRLLQVSPSSGSSLNNMAAFGNDGRLVDALRADPSRKGSVVNVNPVNTRPQSDTPEIRKYKKRFNSEILCAALWGVNLLVGTESGLMLLDRSGQGKVYPLISRRRIQQMDVLEGLNVLVTISGKKNKLRVYYLSWLRNKILHNDPEVEKKQGWVTVGELEGCVHYKVVKYERIKFLVLALKNSVEVYAWAPKPYHKFMAFKSFGDLVHKPLLVDLTVEEGQRLKVIYGSSNGFHAVDVDSGAVYDIYLPTHIQTNIQSHAIIILPNTDGIELLVCYEDEGVYVNTYGRITKDVVLQWGEMPTSVAYIRSNQIMGWGEKAIEIRSVETGHLDGVFMHKRAQRLKFLCERNDKVFFASVRSGGSSQVYFMTLGRTSLLSW
uniref:non-specific serine/threonine protein kinase n=1 Tax=Oncorhynchus mykiss TaxID=8022 RepID=A0A8C7SLG1_ONCMY